MVRPKLDGIWASTPSMMRIRLACEVDRVLMAPLPVRPVSMSMSMPSKLYCLRIGTMVVTKRSATALELRSMPAAAPPIDMRTVAPAAFAAQISAAVGTLTPASMPFSHSTVPSERITGKAAISTLYPCCVMRPSLIGTQPIPGCTPLAAPSQFSQYPWSTLPAGRPRTAQPTGGVVVGGVVVGGVVVGGVVVGGVVVGGVVVGGVVVGGVVVGGVAGPPVHAPRSRHRVGVAAGFQPVPA